MVIVHGSPLYQWDINRQLLIDSADLGSDFVIHCCYTEDANALVVEPKTAGDKVLVNIPNILLQRFGSLRVYVVTEGDTVYDATFYVMARPKPDDYVYTETEVLSYVSLSKRMDEFEKNGVSEEKLAEAINDYLSEHPITETDPTIPAWAKEPNKPEYTASDVGALSQEELQNGVNLALKQAKESGEFETTLNKVQVISENSTDKEYPTAKAVYDFVCSHSGGGGNDNSGGNDSGDDNGGEIVIQTENLKNVAGYSSSGAFPTTETPNADGETYTADWKGWNIADASTSTGGNYYLCCFGQEIAGGVVNIEFDTALITKLDMKIILVGTPFVPVFGQSTAYHIDNYIEVGKFSGTEGEITLGSLGGRAESVILTGSASMKIPDGYYPILLFRRFSSAVVDSTINSNSLFSKYVYDNVTMTCNTSSAVAVDILTIDEDYTQDYGVSTLSLRTEDSNKVAKKTGLDSEYATVIETAKNEWLVESNGNIDKIPLIIHTDQHSNFSKPLWDTISGFVDWYDVGKVINLGDTANSYVDSDETYPLTKCDTLESYIESMDSVPYSKRIEIFGNHDTWGDNPDGTGRYIPQNHLYKYFRNIYARRTDNYGNFVIYDDNYNVKYVVVSGFAYDSEKGGYSHYIIPSDSIDWIISELEKADGYDVIILSHVPLTAINFKQINDLWIARKTKTSGSVTDEYGTTHTFDFTSCNGELLCALHGHKHDDGHEYVGDVLLSAWFDAYYISPKAIHFVLVDRENRRLNVWKVEDTPQYENYQVPFDKPTEIL